MLDVTAGFSLLPLVFLIIYIVRRGRGRRSMSMAITVLVSGLIMAALAYFGGQLGHLDCGDNCDGSVPTYSEINLQTAELAIGWGIIGLIAILDARRQRPTLTTSATSASKLAHPARVLRVLLVCANIALGLLMAPLALLAAAFGGGLLLLLDVIPFVDAFLIGNLRGAAALSYLWVSRIIAALVLIYDIMAGGLTDPNSVFGTPWIIGGAIWVVLGLAYAGLLHRKPA